MADGRLTVKANETAQALTVTAKYGTDSGSATVEVDQAVSPEQLTGIEQIGGTPTSNSDGAYSFTQPNETVTVEATFVPRSQTMPFFDVWPNDWCYEAVHYVNSRGIMGSYGDGTLRPKEQTTRAQAAAMLTWFCEKI